MQMRLLKSDLSVALSMNFLFLLLYLIFGELMYGSLDDYFMSAVLTGAYGSSYDVHLYFINVVFGFILQPLYMLFPKVGWYFFAELGGTFASFVIISYLFLKRINQSFRKEALFLILACLTPDFYFMLNFTQCATLFTATGILAIICGDIDKRKLFWLVGVVMLSAGFVMRKDAFLMGMPFLLVPLLIRFFIQKKLSRYTIIAVLVCMGVTVALYKIDQSCYQSNDYKYYADYQPIRALFVDGNFYDREAIYDELEERGGSELFLSAYTTWFFYDTELYSIQNLNQLEIVTENNLYEVNWAKMPVAILNTLSKGFMNTNAWCWFFFSLLLIRFSEKKVALYPWVSLILAAICFGYLLMINRVVYHVETGVWLYAAISVVPFFRKDDSDEENAKPWVKMLLILIATLLYAATCYGQVIGLKTNLFTKPQYGDSYWLDFQKYVQSHQENVFLLPLFEYQKNATTQNYAYKSIAPGSWANIIPLGFWNVNLPGMKQELETRGVDNPLKDIVNDNVYVATENKVSLINRYYSVFYGKELQIDTVQKIGPLNILKFRQNPSYE